MAGYLKLALARELGSGGTATTCSLALLPWRCVVLVMCEDTLNRRLRGADQVLVATLGEAE